MSSQVLPFSFHAPLLFYLAYQLFNSIYAYVELQYPGKLYREKCVLGYKFENKGKQKYKKMRNT